ncbi:galactoside O-acetyltransferase [Colletotrichum graminicola]|nr:galactoside O-acetyltransferase [Colletotrichum graminicola]
MVPPVRTEKDENAIAHARTLDRVPWCEDYEKMISGMLYSCMAPELVESRNRARRLAQRFNTYVPEETASADDVANTRVGMIKELFGRIGDDVYVEPSLQVDYGCNITVGDRFYANFKHSLKLRHSRLRPCHHWRQSLFCDGGEPHHGNSRDGLAVKERQHRVRGAHHHWGRLLARSKRHGAAWSQDRQGLHNRRGSSRKQRHSGLLSCSWRSSQGHQEGRPRGLGGGVVTQNNRQAL